MLDPAVPLEVEDRLLAEACRVEIAVMDQDAVDTQVLDRGDTGPSAGFRKLGLSTSLVQTDVECSQTNAFYERNKSEGEAATGYSKSESRAPDEQAARRKEVNHNCCPLPGDNDNKKVSQLSSDQKESSALHRQRA